MDVELFRFLLKLLIIGLLANFAISFCTTVFESRSITKLYISVVPYLTAIGILFSLFSQLNVCNPQNFPCATLFLIAAFSRELKLWGWGQWSMFVREGYAWICIQKSTKNADKKTLVSIYILRERASQRKRVVYWSKWCGKLQIMLNLRRRRTESEYE